MGIVRKTVIGGMAAVGLATTSQAPEFAQQYRQRLGGAVEELRDVAKTFDKDAKTSEMTREEALISMKRSADRFSRDRGFSMEETLERFEGLAVQQTKLEKAPPVLRPVEVLQNPDPKVIGEAWRIFEPAVPLTLAGMVWGLLGALFLGGLAAMGAGMLRPAEKRAKSDMRLPKPVRSNLAAPRISREV